MNYFELYPGDYLRDTTRLTMVEHGAFMRLLMAYYAEEQPLPAPLTELYVIAGAASGSDKSAVKKVADRFFPVGSDGLRHNKRADEEIAKATERMEGADERKANDADRKRRSRERRAAMFSALRAVGVVPDFDVSMSDLSDLVAANVTRDQCVTLGVTLRDKSRPVTRDGTATRPQTPDPTLKPLSPERLTHTAPSAAVSGQFEGHERPAQGANPAAPHAIALNRLGHRCTAMNPELVAFVEAGGTVQHLEQVAALPECDGKPAAYVIRIARRELAEQAQPVTVSPNARSNGQPSKTLQGIARLENLIHGNQTDLAPDRDRARPAEAVPALPRPLAGNGRD